MDKPIRFHDLSKLSVTEKHTLLKRTESDLGRYIESVEPIIKAVKEEGHEARAGPQESALRTRPSLPR